MMEQPSVASGPSEATAESQGTTPETAEAPAVTSPEGTTINFDAETGAAEAPTTATENAGAQTEAPISVESPERVPETRTDNIPKEATVVTVDAQQTQEKARQERIDSVRDELEKASEPSAEKSGVEKEMAPARMFDMRPLERVRLAEAPELHIEYKTCEKCKGKGKRFFFFTCGRCRGTGSIPTRKLSTAGSGGFLGNLRSVGGLEFAAPPRAPKAAAEITFAPEAIPRPTETPVETGTTQTANVYEGPAVEATANTQEGTAESPSTTSTGTTA